MPEGLKQKRVAYVPYSADLSAPGDRRRFPFYARLRGVSFEVARPGVEYDVVVLSARADITSWSRIPRGRTRLVYDLIDSYFDTDLLNPKALLRGVGKFLLGHHRHLEPSYHGSLKRMCARADAVVCSTPEQRSSIVRLNPNTHPVLDFQGAAARTVKSSYVLGSPISLLWEGLADNIRTFAPIVDVLRQLASRRPLKLHLVTDLTYRPFNGPIPPLSTERLARRVLRGVPFELHQWEEASFARLCTACDLAVIPMVMSSVYRGKPENKLLLMWRMGIPTITEATPAYARTMRDASVNLAASGIAQWTELLERLLNDEGLRAEAAAKGRAYAEDEQGERRLAERWDKVFESIT